MIVLALLLVTQDAPPPPPAPTTAPSKATEKLVELRALLDNADCDQLIMAAPYVEDHRLATQNERHEAMFAHGWCLVVVGNISQAGSLFRAIFEEDLEASPPFDIEPRVQLLIDAARAKEKEVREARRAADKAKRIAGIHITVAPPVNLAGGERAIFIAHLVDPEQAVHSMRIDFKKERDFEFYGLPLVRQADGKWRGEIPGTYTGTANGVTLRWFVSASDAGGERLVSVGTRDAPDSLAIGPGSAVALDLKASERLPQTERVIIAAVAPVLFSTMFFVGTDRLIEFLALSGAIDDGTRSVLRGIMAPIVSAFGTYAGTLTTLDPTWPRLIPAATVGGLVIGYGVVEILERESILDFRNRLQAVAQHRVQGAFLGAAIVASIAVPVGFVLSDPPVE